MGINQDLSLTYSAYYLASRNRLTSCLLYSVVS
uniref:Uncharacterized protein n=1 Tax=Podoviridae sp. ct8Lf7 TaxID=2827723 RepID=A0A8S5S1K5_9CAUD|nr:MAG TPA: hypothetical protein [Podoviridae sp. ct8Lf7]